MKKLEKWLLHPLVQRLVYFLLLLCCFHLFKSNGLWRQAGLHSWPALKSAALVLSPLLLLAAQLIWNRVWLWRLLCALCIGFTLWLASLDLPQIIGFAGAGAKTLVWWVGIFGFGLLLVLGLAFTNWVLLHLRPRK